MADPSLAQILITFGGLFLIGLVADLLGRYTFLPRVTLLLLAGFIIGPSLLDWLPDFTQQWFPILTDIALAMIGFLLGNNMTRARLSELGRPVLAMSIGEVLMTALLVFSVLKLFNVPTDIALLLAGIAPATAPAATLDVINEYRAKGKFTNTLQGIVAIDDAWGLLVFSVLLAIAEALNGNGVIETLQSGAWEICGAVGLGLLLGLPMALLTGHIRPGEPTQAEALGVVMLCAGLSEWLGVSYILSAITLGAIVANLAKHHERPFRAIEGFEWPLLILFFLLAGAALHLDTLAQVGVLGGGYILLRSLGLVFGAWLGGRTSGVDQNVRKWMGVALLPQAGVAIGMALLVSQRFPEIGGVILPVILGSTVFFELIGPVAARFALSRAGELNQNDNISDDR